MSTFKKAKVVMLSHSNIDTSLTLYKTASGKPLHLSTNLDILSHHTNQHLYIISDDVIKEDDWCIDSNRNIFQHKNHFPISIGQRKIIAITDSSLDLPQPSKQFIQKYVEEYNKGNIITDVLVEYEKGLNKPLHESLRDSSPLVFERLKVNPKDNTITIKKVKDSYNREEVEKLCKKAYREGQNYDAPDQCIMSDKISIEEFIRQNL
jgi:hypothetical protein